MKTCTDTGAHLLTALVREGDRRDPESAPHQVVVHTPVEQFLLMRQDVHLSKFFFFQREFKIIKMVTTSSWSPSQPPLLSDTCLCLSTAVKDAI